MRFTHWLSVVAAAAIVASLLAHAQPKSSRLLVLNKDDMNMAIVDPESGSVLGRVAVGQGPHELATSSDGRLAFASNYGTGPAPGHTISMIDIGAQKELRRIDVERLRTAEVRAREDEEQRSRRGGGRGGEQCEPQPTITRLPERQETDGATRHREHDGHIVRAEYTEDEHEPEHRGAADVRTITQTDHGDAHERQIEVQVLQHLQVGRNAERAEGEDESAEPCGLTTAAELPNEAFHNQRGERIRNERSTVGGEDTVPSRPEHRREHHLARGEVLAAGELSRRRMEDGRIEQAGRIGHERVADP